MNKPKILVCMDFDGTIVSCNTDHEIKSLLNGIEIPEELKEMAKAPNGWNAYIRELFKFMHKNNVTKDDYIRVLQKIPLIEGMKDLLQLLSESNECETIIISDANSFFIDTILNSHQISNAFKKVFTNPAEFDESGCLKIEGLQNQTSCKRCAVNLCKGQVMLNYLTKRRLEGFPFERTLYIGDGSNDVCPAMKLGLKDYVFAREGFRLLRALEKKPARDVKPEIKAWETGLDIRNVLMNP